MASQLLDTPAAELCKEHGKPVIADVVRANGEIVRPACDDCKPGTCQYIQLRLFQGESK
jgi:hypothetical protein